MENAGRYGNKMNDHLTNTVIREIASEKIDKPVENPRRTASP